MVAAGKVWEVLVVGGGHAGCEAANICAGKGLETLLLTGNLDTIARMSCNPAIGGLGKGHMVREIDALGGLMAENADATALQFRLLNRSKGAAVRGPRAQCDRHLYALRMKWTLERMEYLTLFQDIAEEILVEDCHAVGVRTQLGLELRAAVTILTTGTFLRGRLHIGEKQMDGGRLGDFSAGDLAASLNRHGISTGRMKTGTPPRLSGNSIDFSPMERQDGDGKISHFAFYDTREPGEEKNFKMLPEPIVVRPEDQRPCFIAATSKCTRAIVEANLHRSPLYSGSISGRGPRYCPSIEDKFVKFPDHPTHRLFLEPEGISTDEWYVNGLSTSLPLSVQEDLIHSIEGLGRAKILRPAYAVEYDYAPPTQLFPTLESKIVPNLFCAGQINGTSGYEEAAVQGLLAGINAAAKLMNRESLVLGRHEAYAGVLIDDLVTKGTEEPYRMFTGRAEYRLLLNAGGAELRLLGAAESHGLLGQGRLGRIRKKLRRVEEGVDFLERERAPEGGTLGNRLRVHGEGVVAELRSALGMVSDAEWEEIFYRVSYAGYLERERRTIDRLGAMDAVPIPENMDYAAIRGLRTESRQKLAAIRPRTLGQAGRISGVGAADVGLVRVAMEAQSRREMKHAEVEKFPPVKI
ncbi:MAG: tRNA uridine-5-carboxymethylaminomethyl(34) synthesis enzyme MnmG [Puniceicoccales bacterium]|jgi:tRNA uridine 5-carboxymethylaminomethyl modification enzyme|nr:tRNA uridine-5-carboxymethylaminomethyl(34) synthesis enzyme MnmG [Puniceicoccales bacterium]